MKFSLESLALLFKGFDTVSYMVIGTHEYLESLVIGVEKHLWL